MNKSQRVPVQAQSPGIGEQTRRNSGLFRRLQALAVATALIAASTVVAVAAATPALADSSPSDPTTPTTVSADALPTVQINGVVWQQIVVGNTVYAAGSFTSARPAGSAAGVNETPRNNILAYNLQTGVLIPGFAPSLNAQANSLAISPDGTRLYVGGDFTQVNSTAVSRLVALDPTTGALDTSFLPKVGATVSSIVATPTTVYAGGQFTSVGSASRPRVAAFSATGATLLPWNPQAVGGAVKAMVMSPDGSQLVIGGAFTTMNGSANPGYGLAAVDPVSGALLPLGVNNLIRNGGNNAAITSLQSDGTELYGSGFVFGAGGNLEGVFSANWSDGQIKWVADCHGDTYSIYPTANAVYVASHEHYCGNIGGFPQTDPWTFKRATAFGKDVTGTITADPYGYYNYAGTPRPSQLDWYPDINIGTYTGQSQGAWSVSGNSQYVVMGGEFTKVNQGGQQGLVRFAVPSIAPNKMAPVLGGNAWAVKVSSLIAGTTRITWPANWDQDNETLTYQVIRDGNTASPIYTTTANSRFYQLPTMTYLDQGLVPGSTHTYKLIAIDPFGNKTPSSLLTITTAAAGTLSPYASAVLADGASSYWRMDQSSGSTTIPDWAGTSDLVAGSGVSSGATGAIIGDSNTASTFSGNSNGTASTQTAIQGPNTFTLSAWVNTTSWSGGKIIGFGSSSTGNSSSYDRQIYMDNSGRFNFGVYNGSASTVASGTGYNDGRWHQVVASMSSAGMALYVDGVRVGQRSDVTTGQPYSGYWRVGGDSLGSWPNQPWSNNLSGTIDEVAVYPTALSLASVQNQYLKSGRSLSVTPVPTDAYGAAVVKRNPALYWRFDETSGSSAADSSSNGNIGSYSGNVQLNQTGALFGNPDTAAQFNGRNSLVVGSTQYTNPTTFSQALWFKTTSGNGGNLIGFGDTSSGLSNGHDRQIYMETNGKLTFGTWTGQASTVTSPKSYNDGAWHMVVSTFGTGGQQLFVDGALVASSSVNAAQNFTGYWKVGADNTWGPQPYFSGTIDEAAVYQSVLTPLDVYSLYQLGSTGAIANVPPVASFQSTASNLYAAFDASASSDFDGTIASYAWDFGDGTTGTGVTPSHTYTTGGNYQVSLTVTDNQGATNTVTQAVTVAGPPNQPPVAAFSDSNVNLAASFDASASSDPDGSVASYAWDFGDGNTATGVNATHTYTADGSYQVSLTVTDNEGAATSITKTLTVAANKAPVSSFVATNSNLAAAFDASASSDPDGTVASYAWDFGDGNTGAGVKATHSYSSAGSYQVTLTVTDNQGATNASTQTVTVTAPPNQAPVAAFAASNSNLVVAFDASGSSDPDGTVASYLWDFGDGNTGTGVSASHTYAAAGDYQVALTVTDNLGLSTKLTKTVTAAVAVNKAPVASFAAANTDLSASFDATGSTDPDGTVATYSWDFGDGTTAGTGVTATHTYAAAGSYQVTLTVTDNQGATNAITKTVAVTAPAPTATILAKDQFARTLASGLGSADVGGAWSMGSAASNYSVANGVAQFNLPTAGAARQANLNAVSSSNSDLSVTASLSQVSNGGGSYLYLMGRSVDASNDYRAKVLVSSTGSVSLYLAKNVGGTETVLKSMNVAGLNYAVGDQLTIRTLVTGTSPTSISAMIWKTGTTPPSTWQVTTTDSTTNLQVAGGVGMRAYVSGSSTNLPLVVKFSNFLLLSPVN